jgi:AraC-like DNA-binding protein
MNMVQTLIHIPHVLLREFVLSIGIRTFDCGEPGFYKPMHAQHEIHMMFMINCKIHDFVNIASNQNTVIVKKGSTPDFGFSGLLTSLKGSIHFKGHVQLLVIHFKPTGFYRLFGLPPSELTDRLGDANDLSSKETSQLHEQLHEAKSAVEMFQLTESFLLACLNKSRIRALGLEKATNFMVSQPETYSVEELAYHSNMSLKTFERKFIQQVGLSPKLFARIRRFSLALDLKTYQPNLNWLEICYQTGYYDPMHMVKDFKKFAGLSPSHLFKDVPPVYENISNPDE